MRRHDKASYGIAGAGMAAGLIMMAAPLKYEFTPLGLNLMIGGGAVVLIACLGVVVYLLFFHRDPPEGPPPMGDNYNNLGNNFGHMGPINYGKQEYELTQAVIDDVAQALPRDRPVLVSASMHARSAEMAERMAAGLRTHGFDAKYAGGNEVMFPARIHPVTLAIGPISMVAIAPEAA